MTDGVSEKVDFKGLVAGIAASALAVLSQVEVLLEPGEGASSGEKGTEASSPEETRKRVSDGLAGARQLIDTLGMLEEKTKGNLTPEEQELLEAALGELRVRFVSLSSRRVPEEK